jgi:hypothetical protein
MFDLEDDKPQAAPAPAASAIRDPTTGTDGDDIDSGAESPSAGATASGASAAPAAAGSSAQEPAAQPQPNTTTVEPQRKGMLRSILGALGGVNETTMHRDPQTGKMVVESTPKTPGQQWKAILAGGLTGAMAGAGVKPGPGHLGRSASAGFDAGGGMVQEQEDRKRANANEDFNAMEKSQANKAQTAHVQQLTAESAWRMTREKGEFDASTNQAAMDMHNMITSDPTSKSLGTYSSFSDFLKEHGSNGETIGQLNANGELRGVPVFNQKGELQGLQIYQVSKGWGNQRTTQDTRVIVGAKLGAKGEVVPDIQTIPAGSSTNGEVTTIGQSGMTKYMDAAHKKAQAANEGGEVRPRDEFEAKKQKDLEGMRQAGENQRNKDKTAASAEKVSRQDIRDHDKAYVQPAEAIDKSFQMMDKAYNEYKAAKAQGKNLPSGAQSMQALSAHINATFGTVKGARVTKDMIEHHLHARGIGDDARVAVQKLNNGDVLSPAQWEAFHSLVKQSRQISWETAVKQAQRKHIPVDFLPADLAGTGAPEGADSEVFAADGKTLIGHVVKGVYHALGEEKK